LQAKSTRRLPAPTLLTVTLPELPELTTTSVEVWMRDWGMRGSSVTYYGRGRPTVVKPQARHDGDNETAVLSISRSARLRFRGVSSSGRGERFGELRDSSGGAQPQTNIRRPVGVEADDERTVWLAAGSLKLEVR
jgi:hypothetical protein